MNEMKKYELALPSGVITIEVKAKDFPDRKSLIAAIRTGRVIRAVVSQPNTRRRTRSAGYVNMAMVERIL